MSFQKDSDIVGTNAAAHVPTARQNNRVCFQKHGWKCPSVSIKLSRFNATKTSWHLVKYNLFCQHKHVLTARQNQVSPLHKCWNTVSSGGHWLHIDVRRKESDQKQTYVQEFINETINLSEKTKNILLKQ